MKRNFLFALFLVLVNNICFSQKYNPEISPYIKFLEQQNTSAKDYILDLFKKYDIVILCERDHRDATQYDLIYDIVSSPHFHNGQFRLKNKIAVV